MEVEPAAPDQTPEPPPAHDGRSRGGGDGAAADARGGAVGHGVCSAGARRWPWELDICWQTDPPTEKWCSAGCDDIRRGQELWRDAWIEADTSRWKNESWLWGEYDKFQSQETEMEHLRRRLARCRKKSGV